MPEPTPEKRPRVRTVERVPPPYPLNVFPRDFALNVGREIVYILATDPLCGLPGRQPDIEGRVWERIFAVAIGAEWKPSNVGLDDVIMGNCAWGAKTVKGNKPFEITKIRLISGRNSPAYSFDERDMQRDPQSIGSDVLKIWNERVGNLRARYAHMRTVVLIKGPDLSEFTAFETETIMYPPDQFQWKMNKRKNLEGYDRQTNQHRFTWQFTGSQFTIIENVPTNRLRFSVRRPPHLSAAAVLKEMSFDPSWIRVHRGE